MKVEIQIRESKSEDNWDNISVQNVLRQRAVFFELQILVDGRPCLTFEKCTQGNITMEEFERLGNFLEAFEKLNKMHSLFERIKAVTDSYGSVAILRRDDGSLEVIDPTKYVLVMEEGIHGD